MTIKKTTKVTFQTKEDIDFLEILLWTSRRELDRAKENSDKVRYEIHGIYFTMDDTDNIMDKIKELLRELGAFGK